MSKMGQELLQLPRIALLNLELSIGQNCGSVTHAVGARKLQLPPFPMARTSVQLPEESSNVELAGPGGGSSYPDCAFGGQEHGPAATRRLMHLSFQGCSISLIACSFELLCWDQAGGRLKFRGA